MSIQTTILHSNSCYASISTHPIEEILPGPDYIILKTYKEAFVIDRQKKPPDTQLLSTLYGVPKDFQYVNPPDYKTIAYRTGNKVIQSSVINPTTTQVIYTLPLRKNSNNELKGFHFTHDSTTPWLLTTSENLVTIDDQGYTQHKIKIPPYATSNYSNEFWGSRWLDSQHILYVNHGRIGIYDWVNRQETNGLPLPNFGEINKIKFYAQTNLANSTTSWFIAVLKIQHFNYAAKVESKIFIYKVSQTLELISQTQGYSTWIEDFDLSNNGLFISIAHPIGVSVFKIGNKPNVFLNQAVEIELYKLDTTVSAPADWLNPTAVGFCPKNNSLLWFGTKNGNLWVIKRSTL